MSPLPPSRMYSIIVKAGNDKLLPSSFRLCLCVCVFRGVIHIVF